jgi:hypothetical protein
MGLMSTGMMSEVTGLSSPMVILPAFLGNSLDFKSRAHNDYKSKRTERSQTTQEPFTSLHIS